MTRYPGPGDFDEPDDELRAKAGPDGEDILARREAEIDAFNTPRPGQKWCPADFVNG